MSLTRERFLELLASDIRDISDRHPGYSNDGERFTHWVLENVFLLSDSDAKNANYDAVNDGGLDGFYIDSNEAVIHILQCKYTSNLERDERESFTTLPHKLGSPDRIALSNPHIYECSKTYAESLEVNYSVQMSLIYLGDNPSDADGLNSIIQQSLPNGDRERFMVEIISIDDLIVRYLAKNAYGLTVPTHKTLKFLNSSHLRYSNDDINGIVISVAGNELARFGKEPEMFMENFRYFLDLRNKVNHTIAETVKNPDEQAYVWAYNNGITIICDRFDEPNLEDNTIKIYHPQIVNGCQTVSTLNRPPVNVASPNTAFVVRVIASRDAIRKERIATYTNSQTKVTDRTLRSNDRIQKSLQRQFASWSPPYFYECKEGEWESLRDDQKNRFRVSGTPRQFRKISNIEAAKAYLAFHGQPIEAKSSAKMIWELSERGFYSQVFSSGRNAEELLLPFLLSKKFNERIEEKIRELGDRPTGNEAVIKEYLGHADTTLLALAGDIIKKGFPNFTTDVLKLLIDRVNGYATELFDMCNSALRYEVLREHRQVLSRGETFNCRNFFARSDAYENAKIKIDADIDTLQPDTFYRRCGLPVDVRT